MSTTDRDRHDHAPNRKGRGKRPLGTSGCSRPLFAVVSNGARRVRIYRLFVDLGIACFTVNIAVHSHNHTNGFCGPIAAIKVNDLFSGYAPRASRAILSGEKAKVLMRSGRRCLRASSTSYEL
jgi:hypothetical protein